MGPIRDVNVRPQKAQGRRFFILGEMFFRKFLIHDGSVLRSFCQSQVLKSLPHYLSRWDSIKPKANGKELIPIILAYIIKVSFALTQKTNEGSKDFMIFYMWLFTLTQ